VSSNCSPPRPSRTPPASIRLATLEATPRTAWGTTRKGPIPMKAAAAIASILKADGTEYLFCFPINALIDECARLGIRPIVARTERTLLNMADGYSRASNGRRIGIAAVQHGPGAENAYAGVAQAYADGSPLLFLPGGN